MEPYYNDPEKTKIKMSKSKVMLELAICRKKKDHKETHKKNNHTDHSFFLSTDLSIVSILMPGRRTETRSTRGTAQAQSTHDVTVSTRNKVIAKPKKPRKTGKRATTTTTTTPQKAGTEQTSVIQGKPVKVSRARGAKTMLINANDTKAQQQFHNIKAMHRRKDKKTQEETTIVLRTVGGFYCQGHHYWRLGNQFYKNKTPVDARLTRHTPEFDYTHVKWNALEEDDRKCILASFMQQFHDGLCNHFEPGGKGALGYQVCVSTHDVKRAKKHYHMFKDL